MNAKPFLGELKRRNVYRVAVAYALAGWALAQGIAQVFPVFDVPSWVVRSIVVLIPLGFPVALAFAWLFDLTPEGIKRTEDTPVGSARRIHTARKLDFVIIAVLLLFVGVFSYERFAGPKVNSIAELPAPAKSIAVLPFENLSEEKANEFFADGVQDEILTDLSRIADLKVISRSSVMHYKSGVARNLREIGQQLGVANVVEGSVQRSDNRVRVNAQLVDTRTDKHLWGQTYDRDLADVFAIQSEIAKSIADQLQAKLSPNEKSAIERAPTSDINAFDLYAQANDLVLRTYASSGNPEAQLLQAVDLLNQAVARDPSFFDAYCQLARAHDALYWFGIDHTPARLALAEAAIQAAARLRPDAGETHLARAWNRYWGYRDYDAALADLDIASETLPNDARLFELKGYIERRRPSGDQEKALRNLERASELDPRNIIVLQQTSVSYDNLRRYGDEEAILDRALAIEPNDVQTKITRAFVDFDSKANTQPVHQLIDELRVKDPTAIQSFADSWLLCALAERDTAAAAAALAALGENTVGNETVKYSSRFMEGLVGRMAKDEAKARAAFTAARAPQEKLVRARPDDAGALWVLGLIDAGLGRKEEALREGWRAVELLPVEKDARSGSIMIVGLARIAAWVGDKDLACEQLATAIRCSSYVSYGELKLMPWWDPLRGDPCFEQIVASLAPK